uniref:Uncharacterized protein n=1 Tax=Araneus ventricosus TaxID=182803 RepID=A0A4Y2WUV2_ARAVE|nr:hypothetical protein AVEN_240064-1 [Araneus ventricosus]
MSYASPAWGAAAKSYIKKLESAQNIIARQITNSPRFIRNSNQRNPEIRSQPSQKETAPKDTSPFRLSKVADYATREDTPYKDESQLALFRACVEG